VQDGRAEWSYVEHGPLLSNFCRLPVAVVFSGAPLTPPSVWSVVHQRMCLPRISLTSSPLPTMVAATDDQRENLPAGCFYLFSS
jgi:hypothetical protein